jgi:hypothetical protein
MKFDRISCSSNRDQTSDFGFTKDKARKEQLKCTHRNVRKGSKSMRHYRTSLARRSSSRKKSDALHAIHNDVTDAKKDGNGLVQQQQVLLAFSFGSGPSSVYS